MDLSVRGVSMASPGATGVIAYYAYSWMGGGAAVQQLGLNCSVRVCARVRIGVELLDG